MLALLNSDLSLLLKSSPGTGKSLATSLFLLSNTQSCTLKQNIPFITNLLLVPNPYLASQYYTQISKLLKDSPLNTHDVVQSVFRTDLEGEEKQIKLLQQHPGPHILIGTPTRILDILASQYRSDLPLFNLSSIVLDEADVLIPKGQVFSVLKRTNNFEHDHSTSIPTQVLLNHIVPWRNTYMRQNCETFVPLKFLIESSNAKNYLKVVAIKNNWINGRPMPRLGTDSESNLKQELPNDVCSYFTTYNPLTGDLIDTDYDVSEILPNFDDKALKAVSDLSRRRVSQHVKEHAALSDKEKSLLFKNYADALLRTMDAADGINKVENHADTSKQRKRAMVVVPESFSIASFSKVLEQCHGIKGAMVSSKQNDCGFYYTNNDKSVKIDSETFFQTVPKEDEPDVLIVRARQTAGMDFPGLDRIYAMGWDSILLSKLYLTVAGRSRAAPAQEKGELGNKGLWKAATDPRQTKFVVVSLIEQANDMRYNILIAGTMKKLAVEQTKLFN